MQPSILGRCAVGSDAKLHAAPQQGKKGGEVNWREALPNCLANHFDFIDHRRVLPQNHSLHDAPDSLDGF